MTRKPRIHALHVSSSGAWRVWSHHLSSVCWRRYVKLPTLIVRAVNPHTTLQHILDHCELVWLCPCIIEPTTPPTTICLGSGCTARRTSTLPYSAEPCEAMVYSPQVGLADTLAHTRISYLKLAIGDVFPNAQSGPWRLAPARPSHVFQDLRPRRASQADYIWLASTSRMLFETLAEVSLPPAPSLFSTPRTKVGHQPQRPHLLPFNNSYRPRYLWAASLSLRL